MMSSALKIIEELFARIDKVEPKVKAFVLLNKERSRKEAASPKK
jgi:Asp-tRNA(Asn)/Glu-tRNA(Gln) amidotransferase A subunit family amidase